MTPFPSHCKIEEGCPQCQKPQLLTKTAALKQIKALKPSGFKQQDPDKVLSVCQRRETFPLLPSNPGRPRAFLPFTQSLLPRRCQLVSPVRWHRGLQCFTRDQGVRHKQHKLMTHREKWSSSGMRLKDPSSGDDLSQNCAGHSAYSM